MSEVLETNIFFFITGIAVIVCTFLVSIALFHLIKILKTMRRIADRVEAGTQSIAEDIENIRTYVTEETLVGRFMGKASKKQEKTKEDQSPKRVSLRSLKPDRTSRTELKIKNER